MNFCVIGLKWGRNYVKNLEALGHNISFVSSRNQETIPPELNAYRHVTDYRSIDPALVDIACICTPPDRHFEMAEYFIRHRKHVIVEKPFVLSTEEAVQLKEMAAANGVSLLISYQYLWHKDYLACVEKLKDDNGPIHIINSAIGNVGREEYSYLWDYASHDLAMSCNILADAKTYTVNSVTQDDSGYRYELQAGESTILGSFVLDKDAGHKKRALSVQTEQDLLEFVDDYQYNALRQMLSDFATAIDNGGNFTNVDLAITVTEILCSFENKMAIKK